VSRPCSPAVRGACGVAAGLPRGGGRRRGQSPARVGRARRKHLVGFRPKLDRRSRHTPGPAAPGHPRRAVPGDEPARQLRRPGTVTRGELRPRRFPEHALGRSGKASTGCQQPRIEAGAGREGLTLQKVVTKAGDADRLHPGACGQGVDVHECAGWQSEDDGFARNARFLAEKFAELGEVPAQGVERIIRVGEQQFGEPLAARR
jgi:hypothetical protein